MYSLGSEDDVREKVLCPAEEDAGGDGGAEGADGGARGAEEAREVRAPPIPATPSLEEVTQHQLTHRPFRSWCPHCVRGKGR